jgi:hypothetical protein
MLDEVRDAMADANLHHLDLNVLNAAAGARCVMAAVAAEPTCVGG